MRHVLLSSVILLLGQFLHAQPDTSAQRKIINPQFVERSGAKARKLGSLMTSVRLRFLDRLDRQEGRLRRKIARKDPALAAKLFSGTDSLYSHMARDSQGEAPYNGHLDSLRAAVEFAGNSPEAAKARAELSALKTKMGGQVSAEKFVREREVQLRKALEGTPFAKSLRSYQKQAFYFSARARSLRSDLEHSEKWEERALTALRELPAFRDFFQKNSELAKIFNLPGTGSSDPSVALAGLQTRASINSLIQQRFGSDPSALQAIRQNISAAQGQLQQLKDQAARAGNGSIGNGDAALPKGFKPNGQRSKSFLQRLEYGFNLQSQKSSLYFPTTSDLGASLGYKLHDKSSIGIGASFKLGLGRGWEDIRLSGEGIGLRSWADFKIKGSWYVAGGYELNYRARFDNAAALPSIDNWQTSGLVGFSKKYKVSKKLEGNLQLLWDFLSYQQIPRTQAIVFRVGYNIK